MTREQVPSPSRESVFGLLTELERASVASGGATRLSEGEEYLDLRHVERGVRRALATTTVTGNAIARRAVHDDTWRRILGYLARFRGPASPP
jgi:hypothetical protein